MVASASSPAPCDDASAAMTEGAAKPSMAATTAAETVYFISASDFGGQLMQAIIPDRGAPPRESLPGGAVMSRVEFITELHPRHPRPRHRFLFDPLRRVRERAGQHIGQILPEELRAPGVLRNAEGGIVQRISGLIVLRNVPRRGI